MPGFARLWRDERKVSLPWLAALYRGKLPSTKSISRNWLRRIGECSWGLAIFPVAKAMEIRNIVDAGPLIGWLNIADQWHEWSREILSKCRGPLHTTEIVLGEACWQLGGNTQPVHALLDLVRKHALVLARPWPEFLAETQRIMLKYPSMDAAGASLVSLAERSPRALLITTDRRDFATCRGLRNRALHLALPT
jgi:predicted nucleic acid-binding protein